MYSTFGTFGGIVLHSDTGRRSLCSRWIIPLLKFLMVFWFELFPSAWSTLNIYDFLCFLGDQKLLYGAIVFIQAVLAFPCNVSLPDLDAR